MYDIIFITKNINNPEYKRLQEIYPTIKRAESFDHAKEKSLTDMFWCVWEDLKILDSFNFSYTVDDWDKDYIHLFLNDGGYDGALCLCPKSCIPSKREVEYHTFLKNIKKVPIQVSTIRNYDIFTVDSYNDYISALENTTTDMFWAVSNNLSIKDEFTFDITFRQSNQYDKLQNHTFVHSVNDKKLYNGIFLCSTYKHLSKREVEYKYIVTRKEWDIIASGPCTYDKFIIDTYEDYLQAYNKSNTEMFWIIPKDVDVDFDFNLYFSHDNEYDRKINHVMLNGKYHDGIILCSKHSKISPREFSFRFVANKKEHNLIASNPKPYDIVFISYNEPNADSNYNDLTARFPRAKRIHGVKGIHQAHIAAAKLCDTDMFWVVDGDAQIVEDFNFNYQVPYWLHDQVHVWSTKNPINDLVYGYGGVKLLPRQQTIDLDINSTDMTTSISDKFAIIDQVSNVTVFNTDPFSTWKSAFRECVKLASKTIQGQVDNETEERLDAWCTVGNDRNFGEFSISGACAGREYGYINRNSSDALKLINDFDWLHTKFIKEN